MGFLLLLQAYLTNYSKNNPVQLNGTSIDICQKLSDGDTIAIAGRCFLFNYHKDGKY
jgi:hypothetical protein